MITPVNLMGNTPTSVRQYLNSRYDLYEYVYAYKT